MNCSENLDISMHEHQNILNNEQNTWNYNSLYELRPSAETRIKCKQTLRQIPLLAQTHDRHSTEWSTMA
jgi:hypothetical protein